MTISQDKVVAIHYTVTNQTGDELDSSKGGEPLVFLFGHGSLIPGLEQALIGKTSGETFKADIPAAEAYGERHDALTQAVPKTMFEGMDVAPGMRFRAAGPEGQEQSVIILEVTDTDVIVDGNHPLAGIDLIFDVEITLVRDATEEELAHGHVHGIDGQADH
ncbi:FKBP-type peptidyl-prolyl cis-trans isomerase [Rheinheimera salexigens]|uniref:Peptidyl-prolyl cis-trans isomerase n=1 Tax=Rheinheimera salexigens TaxID=1628148 RepID=A0A1E7Q4W1_9GAMM|nr:peptidylprolyl isomerase [Rheinheimera salexigens]OEY69113.1 peptidylprolyl isomerase [Rheinheimera salexigens]